MKALAVIALLVSICSAQPAGHDALNAARWQAATVAKHRQHEAQVIASRIQRNLARYELASKSTGVPPHVIAALHNMESSGDFTKHLHEGSSLKFRTRYVPKGRPVDGEPPFTWHFSAIDALLFDKMHLKNWREIGPALSACEGFNGFGYARWHPETPSPYLYAATSIERPGKYVADGKWSPTARSSQIGVVALWKTLGKP